MNFLMLIIGAATGFFLTRARGTNAQIAGVIAGAVGAVIGAIIMKSVFSILGFLSLFIGAVFGAVLCIWAITKYLDRSGPE